MPQGNHLEKFRTDDLAVLQGKFWVVAVRQKQVTYGDSVVLPLRAVATFADVTVDEAKEVFEILGRLERAASRMGASRVNVIAAMMKDPFVHFHFFPRYAEPISRQGLVWDDSDWPKAVTMRDVDTPEAAVVGIQRELMDAIGAD